MKLSDCQKSLKQIRCFFRVGLVKNAFVAVAGGSGLIGVDSGDDEKTILRILLNTDQPGNIVTDRILIVGRAGTDDHQETVILSG